MGNDTTLCTSDKLSLNAANPMASYVWQDGSSQSTYTVSSPGTYYVNATNECGTAVDSIFVQYGNCACRVFMPSAFTPNGDGVNDNFKPFYKCLFNNYKLEIFNRQGQKLFSSENPENGWDGNINGQQQPFGTYVWLLQYFDDYTRKIVRKNGAVVLIR